MAPLHLPILYRSQITSLMGRGVSKAAWLYLGSDPKHLLQAVVNVTIPSLRVPWPSSGPLALEMSRHRGRRA